MFRKTIVEGQWESISNIYRKTTIVVLASEPVGGRSRATELPCSDFVSQMWGWFGGGGGVMFFSHFMLFPTFLETKSGNTKQLFLI